jgi:predicted porin
MNPKRIAVVLAVLPTYGTLKGDVEYNDVTGLPGQAKVQDDTSYIGFKGSEEIGNGLKSIWQVENRIHIGGTGEDGFGSRQTFVGLDGGDLGMIRIGYLNNGFNDLYAVDQWSYSGNVNTHSPQISGANGLAVFTNSGDRVRNAVRYDSATFHGLSGSVSYGFGENRSKDIPSSSDIVNLGLDYAYGSALGVHYVYQRENYPDQPNTFPGGLFPESSVKPASKSLLEVDYDDDSLFVSGAYQWSIGYDWSDDFAGDGLLTYGGESAPQLQLKARQAALSLGYTLGVLTPKLSVARGWNLQNAGGSIPQSGYSQYVFGVDYAFSKRTTSGFSFGGLKFEQNTASAVNINNGASSVWLRTVGVFLSTDF